MSDRATRGTRAGGREPGSPRVQIKILAIPVKDLVNAKQRLVPLLAADERRALAAAMLEDVLAALASAHLDAVWVITRDDAVTAIARRHHVTVVTEPENRGHTAAVAAAQARAQASGVTVFATIPGDVPCVTSAEVDALIAAADASPADGASPAGAVVFAASRSGLGTNGVALAPPDALALRFGEPSFDNHVAAARARGLTPRLLRLPGLALDVDDPDDLAALLVDGCATRSARLVATWDVAARLADARSRTNTASR
jgi:2-phospho-L-lactate guanylyltransferase